MATCFQELVLTPSNNRKLLFRINSKPTPQGVYEYSVRDIYYSFVLHGNVLGEIIAGGNAEMSVIKNEIRQYVTQGFIVLVGMNNRYGDWYLHFPDLFH